MTNLDANAQAQLLLASHGTEALHRWRDVRTFLCLGEPGHDELATFWAEVHTLLRLEHADDEAAPDPVQPFPSPSLDEILLAWGDAGLLREIAARMELLSEGVTERDGEFALARQLSRLTGKPVGQCRAIAMLDAEDLREQAY